MTEPSEPTDKPEPDLEKVKEKIRLDLRLEPEEIEWLAEEVERLTEALEYLRDRVKDYQDVFFKILEALERLGKV